MNRPAAGLFLGAMPRVPVFLDILIEIHTFPLILSVTGY